MTARAPDAGSLPSAAPAGSGKGSQSAARPRRRLAVAATALTLVLAAIVTTAARQDRGNPSFPGGTNPDGSLRPSPPLSRLFTQDAYTEYSLLDPASASFRIMFLPEETREGATELVNATRGGSEGSGIEVYDPRTGDPLAFTYEQQGNDPDSHAIRARLTRPVPRGGTGRVLIYKTYKDERTYQTRGEDIVWVRSLSGYRLGVILPPGYALTSSNVAAQLTTTAAGRVKLAFANPSGQANPVTIHARPTTSHLTPAPFEDMFFDDIRTLYTLEAPGSGRVAVEQIYSERRQGAEATLDSLAHLPLSDLSVVDLDTAQPLVLRGSGAAKRAALAVPIVNERQSAHLKITGTLTDAYTVSGDTLRFARTLHGLRNTVLLPEGFEITGVSQSGTIGVWRGRPFVALINLNAENAYQVEIRAQRAASAAPAK
jgi:hypothetical protein